MTQPPTLQPQPEPAEVRIARAARTLKNQWSVLLVLLAGMWLLEGVDWLLGNRLDDLGIAPRTQDGLRGILFAPWLHAGFSHLLANSAPFLALGWFVLLRGYRDFFTATFWAMLVGGLGVWLIGETGSVHLGSSILVFGYLGYLLAGGLFDHNLQTLTLTLVALFLYGTLLWGVLPLEVGVSWQGHLFGLLGGGLAAYLRSRPAASAESAPPAG